MQSPHDLLNLMFSGTVASRFDRGHILFSDMKATLMEDVVFNNRFIELQECARAVNAHMTSMNLGHLCTHCSTKNSGGCCSLTMAGETDAIQICMNLLAGVDVRVVRDDGKECVYLGNRGCIFIFKPFFCLNYLCSHINDSARPDDILKLEQLTGRLLTKQYEIEQHILTRIGH